MVRSVVGLSSLGLCLGLVLALPGCASESTPADEGVVGTETNWLSPCDSDQECGTFTCLCGVCTKSCDTQAQCAEATECVEGEGLPSTCDLGSHSVQRGVCLANTSPGQVPSAASEPDAAVTTEASSEPDNSGPTATTSDAGHGTEAPSVSDTTAVSEPPSELDTCFSPAQNTDTALEPGAIGCACEFRQSDAWVCVEPGRLLMICIDGVYQATPANPPPPITLPGFCGSEIAVDCFSPDSPSIGERPGCACSEEGALECSGGNQLRCDGATWTFDGFCGGDCFGPDSWLNAAYECSLQGCACSDESPTCILGPDGRNYALSCVDGQWQGDDNLKCNSHVADCDGPAWDRADAPGGSECRCQPTEVDQLVCGSLDGEPIPMRCVALSSENFYWHPEVMQEGCAESWDVCAAPEAP